MKIHLHNLSPESFKPYGKVLEHDPASASFQILITEQESAGWRIAISKVERKSIVSLHCHPDSMESFEPMSGTTLIIVAQPDKPNEPQAFLLDKPVCLDKQTWHTTVSLSEFSYIKITENAEVGSKRITLESPLEIVLV